MPLKTVWLKYLWNERKSVLLRQAFRMARFHKTPFKTLLKNVLEVTENYQAGFTFPIVASAALRNPKLVRLTKSFHQEIASHGFNHVNYRYLPIKAQRRDIEMSLQTFHDLGITIQGFRAPYNMYTDETPRLLEEFNFLWEAGIGFNHPYCENKSLFRLRIDDHKSNFMCIPLYKWSDDRMIDNYALDVKQMAKILKTTIRKTRESHGVIMFDLHPIRIGQPRYIDLLKQILEYGIRLDGWFPIVTEAVEHWLRYQEWKDGTSFCCLLSGDIDNFTFLEYITRLF